MWNGCVLSVIIDAIAAIGQDGLCQYGYDRDTFLYNGGDGNHFAITFRNSGVVGVLFDHDSDRSPFNPQRIYNPREFFRGMPTDRLALADRCLEYWRADVDGKDFPRATTAVWDQGPTLAAADPWPVVWEHGGHLLNNQLIEDLEIALGAWQKDYLLSVEEVEFARSLYLRKMDSPEASIVVEAGDPHFRRVFPELGTGTYEGQWRFLARLGLDVPDMEREERPCLEPLFGGYESGWRLLADLGILLPANDTRPSKDQG